MVPAQIHEGARPQENIYFRGETIESVYVLCFGWAFRFIQLSDGRRQILSFLLAGDVFSGSMVYEEKSHFSVQALTDVRFARIDRADLRRVANSNYGMVESLGKLCAVEQKDAEERITDLGRRSADERIARLILNLTDRLDEREVVRERRYPFPLRQQHIADITGLTPVHVGRVMGAFRKAGLIDLTGGFLTVINQTKLERIGGLK
jgi:CRP-like cAMP-binding protein